MKVSGNGTFNLAGMPTTGENIEQLTEDDVLEAGSEMAIVNLRLFL